MAKQISVNSLKFRNPTHQFNKLSLKTSKITQTKNKTVSLINNYYDDLISFKHLKIFHYISLFFILILSIFTVYVIVSNQNKMSEYIVGILTFINGFLFIFIFIKESFTHCIIKDYNKKYCTNFSYFWQTQDDWLCRNFGKDYDAYQLFNKFDDWNIKRDKFSTHKPFSFLRYTYQSDAKPRINALIIAFLSLNAVIFINMSRPIDFGDFISNIIQNFFYIGVTFIFIAIFFYSFVFFSKIIIEMIFYFHDVTTNKNSFSEEKYKKFMGLLSQKIEVNINR